MGYESGMGFELQGTGWRRGEDGGGGGGGGGGGRGEEEMQRREKERNQTSPLEGWGIIVFF